MLKMSRHKQTQAVDSFVHCSPSCPPPPEKKMPFREVACNKLEFKTATVIPEPFSFPRTGYLHSCCQIVTMSNWFFKTACFLQLASIFRTAKGSPSQEWPCAWQSARIGESPVTVEELLPQCLDNPQTVFDSEKH